MTRKNNIERNKLDYILTDTLPVEISELYSHKYFYDFLAKNHKEVSKKIETMLGAKSSGRMPISEFKSTQPHTFHIAKADSSTRKMSLIQPYSVLEIYFFIAVYEKDILAFMHSDFHFSIRYYEKESNLYYKKRSSRSITYLSHKNNTSKLLIQQTGRYFKIAPYNSIVAFTSSREWLTSNLRFKKFAKIDIQSCFDSIYTHAFKWFSCDNVIDSKNATNANLYSVLDRLLQDINGKKSNGIPVGAEFSRLAAEILLQRIDNIVRYELMMKDLLYDENYLVFRYVDDVYIFAHNDESIDSIIDKYEYVANKFKLNLNAKKTYRSTTPIVTTEWLQAVKIATGELLCIFNADRKESIFSASKPRLSPLVNSYNILICKFEDKKDSLTSYLLKVLLNNISRVSVGVKLFENKVIKPRIVLSVLKLAFYYLVHSPKFEHCSKVISLIAFFDRVIDFNKDPYWNRKLNELFLEYAFIFKQGRLTDLVNFFPLFNQYGIVLPVDLENYILSQIIDSRDPILLANYIVYSQYSDVFSLEVCKKANHIIRSRMDSLIKSEPMLNEEFWYIIIFYNWPGLDQSNQQSFRQILDLINTTDLPYRLLYKYMTDPLETNGFFSWTNTAYKFSQCLTYRSMQRTLFRSKNGKKSAFFESSLD